MPVTFTKVYAGASSVFCLDSKNQVWSVGRSRLQFCHLDFFDSMNVVDIVSSTNTTLFLTREGQVYQLRDIQASQKKVKSTPVLMSQWKDVTHIVGSTDKMQALDRHGSLLSLSEKGTASKKDGPWNIETNQGQIKQATGLKAKRMDVTQNFTVVEFVESD